MVRFLSLLLCCVCRCGVGDGCGLCCLLVVCAWTMELYVVFGWVLVVLCADWVGIEHGSSNFFYSVPDN